MEELAMQSGMVELGIWEVFVQSRISISIIFLANVISILIAVWLSRVLIEKGANLFFKLIFTALLLQFFLMPITTVYGSISIWKELLHP